MIRLFPFAVLLLCLILSTVQAEEESWSNLFPLAIDNSWTYRISGNDEKLTLKVVAIDKIGGIDCFRIDATLNRQQVGTEHLRLTDEGVFRYRVDRDDVTPPLCILKFPAKEDGSWENEYKLGVRGAKAEFKSTFEAVNVPAGKYKALLVKCEMTEGNMKVRASFWYANKVGLVKQQFEQGKQTLTFELEKFEAGKK